MRRAPIAVWIVLTLLLAGAPAARTAEPCRNVVEFRAWLAEFRREAAAAGVSEPTLASTLDGLTADPAIIARDRRQGFFWQDFLAFSARLATRDRIASGAKRISAHRALFDRVEKEYGVPAPVIAAFWALESDFGLAMGQSPTLRSLATLAWDCRRGGMFRAELLAALKIIDRGDLKPSEMIGAWAGELGQTQFLPSRYLAHAVDYDGDGRRNLLTSTPDVVASTAAYLVSLGWRRGEPWVEEVRVPERMAWEEADPAKRFPIDHWAQAGVTRPDGTRLPAGRPAAALLLPMGRHGPAFLAYPNFDVYTEWNHSLNYALTAACLATRLGGAPPMQRGNAPVTPLTGDEVRELQRRLVASGFPLEKIDGKLGSQTRTAVREAQLRYALPADGWPTAELLRRLAR